MSDVTFKINSGLAPFHVEFVPDNGLFMDVGLGTYTFVDVPAGFYCLKVTDSLECEVFLCYIAITTTTTTIEPTTTTTTEEVTTTTTTEEITTTTTTV